jgi:membrane-bound ClpP family serine protease
MFYPLHKSACSALAILVSRPDLALVAAAVGLLGVYAEFCLPGKVVPGALGAALVVVGCWALGQHPLNALGLVLVALAAVCVVVGAGHASRRGLLARVAMSMALVSLGLRRLVAIHPIRGTVAFAVCATLMPVSVFLASTALRARRNKLLDGEDRTSRLDMLEGA